MLIKSYFLSLFDVILEPYLKVPEFNIGTFWLE